MIVLQGNWHGPVLTLAVLYLLFIDNSLALFSPQ